MKTFTAVVFAAVAAALCAEAFGHPHYKGNNNYGTAAIPDRKAASPGFMELLKNEALVRFLLALARIDKYEKNTGDRFYDLVETSDVFNVAADNHPHNSKSNWRRMWAAS